MNGDIKKASKGKADIDDVMRALASYDREITVEQFREIVTDIAGEAVDALKPKNLPGCSG
jgi:predicted metalloprotease with PDZ domain